MSKSAENSAAGIRFPYRIGGSVFCLEISVPRGYLFLMQTMPHRDFYALVKAGDPVKTRNRLQTASDKELFLALFYLDRLEQTEILRLLSPEKASRVRDIFARGIRFGQEEYRTAVKHLVLHLSADVPPPSLRSWYRPGNSRG